MTAPAGVAVHVWWVARNSAAWTRASRPDLLSADESDRADRFLASAARARFIAGRAVARQVLGEYLETSPAGIEFAYSAAGKPSLAGAHQSADLHFSLSHAGDVVMLAVARDADIGIDVEEARPGRFTAGLIDRVFGEEERCAIAGSADREAMCYRLWVRKEACVKASGEGIAAGLAALDARGDRCVHASGGGPRWRLVDIPMPAPYVAAIAVGHQAPAVTIREFEAKG